MPASPSFNAYLEDAYIAKYMKKIEHPDFNQIRKEVMQAGREYGEYFKKQLVLGRLEEQLLTEMRFEFINENYKIGDHHVRLKYSFLIVHTNEGITGLGEACLEGKARVVDMSVKDFEYLLIGQDPRNIEYLWNLMYRATF
jgi:hypothetical protein